MWHTAFNTNYCWCKRNSYLTTDATCTTGGSITVAPFGGIAPYSVTIGGATQSGIAEGGSTTFSLSANTYSITITDARPCTVTKSETVGTPPAVTANAGADFTKTCVSNTSGKQIGEASQTGFSYSWSPALGLSDATISNPTANPTATTTYTVTKTSTSTGCHAADGVTVTGIATVTANAGSDFTQDM